MSLRKISFKSGEFYHIYNRGNSKQAIFRDNFDYDRFLKLLFLSNCKENFKVRLSGKEVYDFVRGEELVNIVAYCLMPNHFHILLTPNTDDGTSKFMQKLSTGYSMYFNKKYNRTGGLFEGKFRSEHADRDEYLKYLFSYIHLNPIKLIDRDWKNGGVKDMNQTVEYLENYRFSSYLDYTGSTRPQNKIINAAMFPEYFSSIRSIKDEISSWLNFQARPGTIQVLPGNAPEDEI